MRAKTRKQPKPEPALVKCKFETSHELQVLESIKKITGEKTGTKAVMEALQNYPNLVKKADALNTELIKVNREHESLQLKVENIKNSFQSLMNFNNSHPLDDDIEPVERCPFCKDKLVNDECPNCD